MDKNNKMKKILIVTQAMEIGGAEKALLGLLETIDKSKYQIDLFLLRHTGELLKEIPEGITLLPEKKEYSMLGIPIKETWKQGKYGIFFGRLKGNIKANIFSKKNHFMDGAAVNDEYSHKYTVRYMPMISNQEYDLAISFLAPHYFVSQKVNAIKKIAWIHTDYGTVEIDRVSELNMWSDYDHIVSISENVTKNFLRIFPGLKNKIILFENIMPVEYIKRLANSRSVDREMPSDANVVLLSIGRFCTAKNFDNVPDICKRIVETGIKVKWYLIGYGPDEELIKNKIKEAKMQDHVCILGKKENPYPYIKRCDIYVQPSRYEGKCVSVIEAQMFDKPVVITRYDTAESQLRKGIDGKIVPIDNQECADGIIELLKNKEERERYRKNCSNKDFSNSNEISKVDKFFK